MGHRHHPRLDRLGHLEGNVDASARRGHRHHVAQHARGPQSLEQCETVPVGQVQVEQHQVDVGARRGQGAGGLRGAASHPDEREPVQAVDVRRVRLGRELGQVARGVVSATPQAGSEMPVVSPDFKNSATAVTRIVAKYAITDPATLVTDAVSAGKFYSGESHVHYGSLVVDANGNLVSCSRTNNARLFGAVVEEETDHVDVVLLDGEVQRRAVLVGAGGQTRVFAHQLLDVVALEIFGAWLRRLHRLLHLLFVCFNTNVETKKKKFQKI